MKFKDVAKRLLMNKFSMRAFAARTLKQDPLQGFMFRVMLSDMSDEKLGFTKVSGLSREVSVVEYFENMYDHAYKLPGRESVQEVTFEKGMYADTTFVDEFEKVLKGTKNEARHEVTIQIMNRFNEVARTFKLFEAWFSKYEVGDLDAGSDDVIVETLTVQFEYMKCK